MPTKGYRAKANHGSITLNSPVVSRFKRETYRSQKHLSQKERVRTVLLANYQAMQVGDLAPSVLGTSQLSSIGISKTKTITVFDNVLRLPKPVPLHELRGIGCGEAHQLITS